MVGTTEAATSSRFSPHLASASIAVLMAVHFLGYLLTLLRLPDALQRGFRVGMVGTYMICVLSVYTLRHRREAPWAFVPAAALLLLVILKALLVPRIPLLVPFGVAVYLLTRCSDLRAEVLDNVINLSFLVYFTLSLAFTVGLLPASLADAVGPLRDDMPNRLLPGVSRFLGAEGLSPAGIDSFAGVVLFWNLTPERRSRSLTRSWSTVSAIVVLVWTSSRTPIAAALVAVTAVLILRRVAWTLVLLATLIPFVFAYIHHFASTATRLLLQAATALRVVIWHSMLQEFLAFGPRAWFFGSRSVIEVPYRHSSTANPHNLVLDLLLNYGAVLFLVVVAALVRGVKGVAVPKLPLVLFILLSSLSNKFFLNIYNPIPMFVLMWCMVPREPTEPHWERICEGNILWNEDKASQ